MYIYASEAFSNTRNIPLSNMAHVAHAAGLEARAGALGEQPNRFLRLRSYMNSFRFEMKPSGTTGSSGV